MLVDVKAKFSCDRCGACFIVGVTPAGELPKGWSVAEAAEDAIRGGLYYEEPHRPGALGSVDCGRHLCSRCTDVLARKAVV